MKKIAIPALMPLSIAALVACGGQSSSSASSSKPMESSEATTSSAAGTSAASSEATASEESSVLESSTVTDDYAYGKYVVADFETELQASYYESDEATLSVETKNTFESSEGALRVAPSDAQTDLLIVGSPNITALGDYAVIGARVYVEDETVAKSMYTYTNFLMAQLYHGDTLLDSYKIVRANIWTDIAFNLTSASAESLDDGSFFIRLNKYIAGVDEEENDIILADTAAPEWELLVDDIYVSPLDSKIENEDTFGGYVTHDFDTTGKTIYDSENGWGGFGDGFQICFGHGFVDDYERFIHTSDVTDYSDFMGPGTRTFAGAYAAALGQTWRWASYMNDAFIIDIVATKKISLQLVTSDLITGWATSGDLGADINNTFYLKRAEDTLPTTLAKRDNSSKDNYQFAEIQLNAGDHFYWHFLSSSSNIIILECLWNYVIGTPVA